MNGLVQFSRRAMQRWAPIAASFGFLMLYDATAAPAQEADADQEEAAAPAEEGLLSADELRIVVAPVAFYPDDVLALVLPASTTGIQIVQAQRFLEKQKSDSSLQPNEEWDPSILALINYPDVVDKLNADLDWTEQLGNAVLDQQGDVMDAIQQARAEAAAAGYLKSDDKQTVTQDQDTVVIQSADPEVVYVPDYDPEVIVQQTYATYPPPAYYDPYPPYYSPGATFFAGAITGAAFAYAFDWDNDDIDINDGGWGGNNTNINTGDINIGNKIDADKFNGDRVRNANGDKVKWNPDKQRQKRDTASTKRKQVKAAPLGKGTADKTKLQKQNRDAKATKGNKKRVGEQKQRNQGGLTNPQNNRKAVKDSKRGNKSLSGASGGNRRQGGNSQLQTQKKRQGAGAFGGQGSGKKVGAQKSRGQKSMGSKPRRR